MSPWYHTVGDKCIFKFVLNMQQSLVSMQPSDPNRQIEPDVPDFHVYVDFGSIKENK